MSSDAPKATARKVLLNSGSRRHGERFPLDGSKPLPDAIPEDEDDEHRDTGAFGGVKPAAAQQPEQPAPPPQEPTMPRGQYDRSKSKKRKAKKSAESAAPDAVREAEATGKKPRRARKARAQAAPSPKRAARAKGASGATFGYFSDGSLVVNCEDCTGKLSPADLVALREFTKRFEGKA